MFHLVHFHWRLRHFSNLAHFILWKSLPQDVFLLCFLPEAFHVMKGICILWIFKMLCEDLVWKLQDGIADRQVSVCLCKYFTHFSLPDLTFNNYTGKGHVRQKCRNSVLIPQCLIWSADPSVLQCPVCWRYNLFCSPSSLLFPVFHWFTSILFPFGLNF